METTKKKTYQKLDNLELGIGLEMGSIVYIPKNGEFDNTHSIEESINPYKLFEFGPKKESLLIIPEYQIKSIPRGVLIPPIIPSEQIINKDDRKIQPESELSENKTYFEIANILLPNTKINSLTKESSIDCLKIFSDPIGKLVFETLEQCKVSTLSDLFNLPQKNPSQLNFIENSGLFPEFSSFILQVGKLIEYLNSLNFNTSQSKEQMWSSINISNEIISQLESNALINSPDQLSTFPHDFPSIYQFLCLRFNNLAQIVDQIRIQNNLQVIDNQKLGDSNSSIFLLEPNSIIDNLEPTTSISIFKPQYQQLISKLNSMYPPILNLQDLVVFYQIKPKTYIELLLQYPSLSTICQNASLLLNMS